MRKIRQGMEIARLLLDLVGKRERLKQRQLNIMQELFEEQLLLGNDALESPKVKAKAKVSTHAKKAEKGVLASPRKAETLRRKSTGTSGKSTMQQEIEEAIKKTSTTSRRKSTAALSSDGSKKNMRESEHDPLLPEPSLVRPSDNGATKTRPRATKKRRQSGLVIDVVGVADKMEEAISSTAHHPSLKRKRDERLKAEAEAGISVDTEQNPPSEVKIKRLAKRKRRSNTAPDTQTQENEADSTSTGKFVHTKAVEKEAAAGETRDDELNKSEDDDDQDYAKGKRKRKRRSINEVTDQRYLVQVRRRKLRD